MSTFPTSLDNLPESHADGTGEVIHASTINNLASAVNAVESVAQPVVNGITADVTAANLNALTGGGATSLHSHAGGGPSSGIQYVDVQLNDTQIKALPSAAFEIVSSDVSALFLGAFVRVDNSVGYSTISDGCTLQFSGRWNNSQPLVDDIAAGVSGAFSLVASGNRVAYFPPELIATPSTLAEGLAINPSSTGNPPLPLALYVSNADGDFIGGDPANTMSIRLWYAVVPAAPFGA